MRRWLLPGVLVALVAACAPPAAAAPANDAFAAADPLAVGTEVSASNVDATVEPGEPNPSNSSQAGTCLTIADGPDCGTSVWYAFQPSSSGQYTIETCDGGTDFNSVLGVYTGTLGSPTEIGYSYQGPACPGVAGGSSQLTFNATGGTLYHVDVTGYYAEQGSFLLRAYPGPAHARPTPDTEVIRESSLSDAINTRQSSPGVHSGPRRTASFALRSTAPGASFECSLDGAPPAPCPDTVSYDDLAPGSSHVLSARAVAGGVADPSPAVQRFTLDTAPPDTLLAGPSGPYGSQTATWTATSSERYNPSYVRCGLDGQPLIVCNRDTKVEHLCAGPHTFRAAAVDYATNIDPTPAEDSIDVSAGPPCAAPSLTKAPSASTVSNSALVFVYFDDGGAGGRLHLEYGPTASYGTEANDGFVRPEAGEDVSKASLLYLAPNSTYHYRVKLTTPFGSATSEDQTVTTSAAPAALPTISNGTPAVAGEHAATLPATLDPAAQSATYFALIEPGAPVGESSPAIFAPDTLTAGAGPQAAEVRVVDLEAATTYHYAFVVEQQGGGSTVLGPEGTFTTPPYPTARARFRLRRKLVRVGRLTRRSKRLVVALHGLPGRTKVKLKLSVGGAKQSARRRARANGRLTFRLVLSRRIRKALHKPRLKRARVRLTATPPGEAASSLTLSTRIRKAPKHRHGHGRR
jgi:hypothetical protein